MELTKSCAVETTIATLISVSDIHAELLTRLAAESRISAVGGTPLFPSIAGMQVLVEALLATVLTERRPETTKHIGHIENVHNDCGVYVGPNMQSN